MPLANSSITFKAFFMFCHGLIQFHLVKIIWNQQLVLFYLNLNWNKWMCLEDLSFSSFASSFKAWSSILYFCMFLIKCYSFLILIGTFRLTKLNNETIVTFFLSITILYRHIFNMHEISPMMSMATAVLQWHQYFKPI